MKAGSGIGLSIRSYEENAGDSEVLSHELPAELTGYSLLHLPYRPLPTKVYLSISSNFFVGRQGS